MFYFVTLFNVPAAAEETFVRGLGRGGPWLEQVRRVTPALVGADLLRHQSWPVFLCQDIWTAPEGYAQACGSRAVRQLLDARKQMAASSFEIGGFTFPKLQETAGAGSTRLPHSNLQKSHQTQLVICCTELHGRALDRIWTRK